MPGAIVMVVLLVIVIPVVVLLSGAVGSALLGALLKGSSDADNRDAEGNPNEYLVLSESDHHRS